MKAITINAKGESQDVTEIIGELSLSGASAESARTLETGLIRRDVNPLLPGADAGIGDTIIVSDDEEAVVFQGVIWTRNVKSSDMETPIACYDIAVYLNKSDPKEEVYADMTPDAIAKKVCDDLGIKTGALAKGDKVTINARGQKAYDAIMQAYTKQHDKDGKHYKLVAKGDTIHVVESGERHPVILEELDEPLPGKILDLDFAESMDEIVNAITVIDENKGDETEEVDDKLSQEQYGKIQKVIRGDAEAIAGVMKDAKVEAEVEVIADWDMQTGKSVYLNHELLAGEFYIIADKHQYRDGVHTAQLTLSTDYEMDKRTEGQAESSQDANGEFPGGEGDGQATGKWLDPTKGAGVVNVNRGAHYHGNAVDIAAPVGTPLYASDGGTVSHAGWMGSYGNVVFINHGNGYQTRYAHMSSIGVSNGQKVSRGQMIGRMGSTGNSTGSHIHFEILRNGVGTYPPPLIGR